MIVTIDLDAIVLARGSHEELPPDEVDESCELCLFEWRNWLTSRVVTDSCPSNVSPLLHAFGMSLNDRFPGEKRQQLKRFLPQPDGTDLLAGTADDGLDDERGYLALDWLIRTYTPAWLDLVGLTAEAAELRALRRIVDKATAERAGPIVNSARDKAAAAWAAAWAAARVAAWAAARAAARAAAWAAAWAAAGVAARDAAWAAAWAAAWDAAVWERLAPTVDQLQDSAINLYAALINPRSAAA